MKLPHLGRNSICTYRQTCGQKQFAHNKILNTIGGYETLKKEKNLEGVMEYFQYVVDI